MPPFQLKKKNPSLKNHGGAGGTKRYSGTVFADKSTNIPIAFVIDNTETRLLFERNPDPVEEGDENQMWLWLPDLPGFYERGIYAIWNPAKSGTLLGKHFEIYSDHKSGVSSSYEPTDKTIKVVFEDVADDVPVAEPVVAEPVLTLEQSVMATITSVPQNVKTILKAIQIKNPLATKSDINSIIYKNSKTLKKTTIAGVSAPLWSV
jgi:hypothetical protein